MNYKETLQTKNISPGINTREYIILHHTASGEGSIKGVLNTLTTGKVSCHYVVDTNGDTYKIGRTQDLQWHCGVSSWKGKKGMNKYSLGIEVIGPLTDGGFTKAQRVAVRELVTHLMKTFNIPKENILRHADLTWSGSEKGILWDGISKNRKVDIADTFWNHGFATWEDYQNSY